MFIKFLESLDWDHSVILDLLSGPETCCLPYLLNYLKLMNGNWQQLLDVCAAIDASNESESNLDSCVSSEKPCEHSQDLQSDLIKQLIVTEINVSNLSQGERHNIEHLPDVTALEQSLDVTKDNETDICASSSASLEQNYGLLASLVDYPDSDSDVQSEDEDVAEAYVDNNHIDKVVPESPYTENTVDKVMTVLIRLRIKLDRLCNKGLFPYNVKPIIVLIEQCEELYENQM